MRASSIVSPQYVIIDPKSEENKHDLPEIPSEDLRLLRCYIEQIKKINPVLKDDIKEI